ncbi:deoxyhypusine synthase [Archaeoglobus fulgidus]|jgi:deoxyhypusine synthase|uniref:Probable deoxyhypusine synthase 1 n=3 Tax=Archaeoglobus fulgidus TaxID=2234 RepID=DHYS1_ARCFU|nr:deoxyhypusine synthase [Archaeoglobus fulgidus]O28088.1 RecName: Full=Probable deoxyhypusine synthase 1; Short=DHS 1 [Archaeoglobus fulgidus DSM 4304]AAB89061.1 deoxyhypusine synthase (dys1-1) [Archaeoglobus fulgidus DSM 4304]AIG99183.1 deoxyhypusine synthase [Archaeoglobus fulgidus DSM 8774]KUJ93327.1 MAG: putative deoxyhypusine synthase 1 [Archaeoglobus fulgidus]KUK07342.1 MAG: putative deoxyhypusine synthase 1 [Archaeoglobus fulgidus]
MRVTSPEIQRGIKVSELLDMFGSTAFNARRLGEAAKICEEMVKSDSFVFLTLAGAMIPAGMRKIVAGMMQNGFISSLVTTGANIVHEIVESLGIGHEIGSCYVDDTALAEESINRIYDVFVGQEAFERVEEFLSGIIEGLDGIYTTYEFLWEVGKRIPDERSFLRIAAEREIPVFCPTLHDSIAGLHMTIYRKNLQIDFFRDVSRIIDFCFQKRKMGVIVVGGGVPKNFTLQAMLLAEGFDYAVQITTDSPQWGGLSGATLEEAKSWCKLKPDAKAVTVYCDATIALPMLYAYLLDRCGES